jgi:hypothetical protein
VVYLDLQNVAAQSRCKRRFVVIWLLFSLRGDFELHTYIFVLASGGEQKQTRGVCIAGRARRERLDGTTGRAMCRSCVCVNNDVCSQRVNKLLGQECLRALVKYFFFVCFGFRDDETGCGARGKRRIA